MTATFYIDDVKRREIATRGVIGTLIALHLWATIIVIAALKSAKDSEMLSAMFSTITFGIGATLAILLVGNAADIVIARIFGAAPAGQTVPVTVTETVQKTVTTTPNPPSDPLGGQNVTGDVNMNVEGSVNVGKS